MIVVGTHYDKVSGREKHRELRENVELIDRLYGAGAAQVTRWVWSLVIYQAHSFVIRAVPSILVCVDVR